MVTMPVTSHDGFIRESNVPIPCSAALGAESRTASVLCIALVLVLVWSSVMNANSSRWAVLLINYVS